MWKLSMRPFQLFPCPPPTVEVGTGGMKEPPVAVPEGVHAVVVPRGSGAGGGGGGGGSGEGGTGAGVGDASGGVGGAAEGANGTVSGPWHKLHDVVCPARLSAISITLAQ